MLSKYPASHGMMGANRPTLYADFMSGSLILGRGGVLPSFTRATPASQEDQDKKINQVLSGEARFGGFRRVQNLILTKSEDMTNVAYQVANGATRTATVITFPASASAIVFQTPISGAIANPNRVFVARFRISSATPKAFRIRITHGAVVDYTSAELTSSATPTVFSFSALVTGTGGSGIAVGILNNAAGTAGDLTVEQWQLEEVTGQTNQNPSEYISVGVLSAPYQGANVDGVQYFPYLNGNTVASNVVTEARGANINGNSNIGALPGASGAYFSTPDAPVNSITGNIDVRTLTALPFSTNTGFYLAKYGAAGQISWGLYGDGAGRLIWAWSADGTSVTTKTSSVTLASVGVTDNTQIYLRVTFAVNNGAAGSDAKFYYSYDGTTWAQLGTTQTTAGVTSIFDSTSAITVGASATGGSAASAGRHYRAQIYNGINGTLAVDFNPNSWASGATWVSATGETWTINGGASVVAVSLGGYLPEPAATQLVTPLASVRNLTDVSWVKTSCTAAQTAVGADGVANKGSTITGTAINWTCLQTLVAAATSRTVSMLVRRRTGTGAIFLLQNATTLDITAAINSTTYTLVQLNANVLNSAFGIGGSVSGDAVDVDFVQFEAGNVTGLVNSRIPDSISVRSADVLTYATTGWLNAAAGTLYAEFFNSTNTGASAISAVLSNGTANNFVRTYRSSTGGTAFADVADGGVTQSNLSVGAVATGAPQKIVSVYQANDFAGFVNNTSLGTDVAGTIPALTQLDIGHQNGGALLGHYVRKVAYYPIRMLSGTAQGLTL